MAVEVEMPQLSDTMEKGTIVRWLKEEGDSVERGDVLAEVETDKATMDLEAFDDGVLLKRLADEGDDVPTQALIAVIGEEGEDISGILDGDGEVDQTDEAEEAGDDSETGKGEETSVTSEEQPSFEETPKAEEPSDETPEADQEEPEPQPTTDDSEETPDDSVQSTQRDGDRDLRVSPVARRIAANNRIDLYQLDGSGPQGRIIKKDVEEAIREGRAQLGSGGEQIGSAPSSPLEAEQRKLSGMRKTIAERMSQSKREAPHFYLTREIDMERLADVREEVNESLGEDEEYSYNDFVMAASSRALCEVPEVNGSYQGDHLQLHDRVDLGFAVAVDEGLFTPVIEKAEQKSISEIHQRSQELIGKAREGDLTPDDYQGGTFTISNLGMFDISNFTAVINPPQAAILAVGAVEERPVAVDGDVEVRERMEVTLSCDHRAIDGVHGSRYLQELANLLEHPIRLLA